MLAAAGEDCECGAAALFDEPSDAAAAAAAAARVPTCKGDFADAHFWQRRYASEAAAAPGAAAPAPYEWCAPRRAVTRAVSAGALLHGSLGRRLCVSPCGSRRAARRYDVSYAAFRAAVAAHCRAFRPGDVCVQLGCGTSAWGRRLAADTRCAVLDSDVDPSLLARLARRGAADAAGDAAGDAGAGGDAAPTLSFAALDATAPALRRACCDWVLDKGTMDALSCHAGALQRCGGGWNKSADSASLVRRWGFDDRVCGARRAGSAGAGRRCAGGVRAAARAAAAAARSGRG
jgi:hypothetical protein